MISLFELLREILPKDSVMLESYKDATKALPHLVGAGVNMWVMQEPLELQIPCNVHAFTNVVVKGSLFATH